MYAMSEFDLDILIRAAQRAAGKKLWRGICSE